MTHISTILITSKPPLFLIQPDFPFEAFLSVVEKSHKKKKQQSEKKWKKLLSQLPLNEVTLSTRGPANASGLMSDNVAVVTLRGWARGRGEKKNQKTRLCCHLITGRRHENGVISEKRFKRWGGNGSEGEGKKIPAGEREKGKDSEGETWGVKQKAERGKRFKQSDENSSASFPDVAFRVQT